MEFVAVDDLRLPASGGIWNTGVCYISGRESRCAWHCATSDHPPYCCVEWNNTQPDTVICRYVSGQEHQIAYTRNLIELLGLELFLLWFDALLLHASLVEWEGKGILFCAPSGTGKSTQAELWKTHLGGRILNGDRAGICCRGGVWEAWGLPYAGTSGIYCNSSVPVSAVVLLHQGPCNEISPVLPPDAFKFILPQCNARWWDVDFMDRLTGQISAFVDQVPVYRLDCKADVEAVELLQGVLIKET